MAHKYEIVSTGGGIKVKNGTVTTTVINQDGTLYVNPKATVEANATGPTLTAANFGKIQTNTGASGSITATLPTAASVKGQAIRFQVTVAQTIVLDPLTLKIYLGGSGVADKTLTIAGVIGNFCELYSDGTDFLVTNYSGVLTKES